MRILIPFLLLINLQLFSSPLMPVKLDSPRDTMKSYVEAMGDYLVGVNSNDPLKRQRLNDAIRCFDLEHIPFLSQKEKGQTSALLLKEVLDRFILLDFSKIPDDPSLTYWRLKDSEIIIRKKETGERKGQFLISEDTVNRLPEFFNKVKHLPFLPETTQGSGYKESLLEQYVPEWGKGKVFGIENWKWLSLLIFFILAFITKFLTDATTAFLCRWFANKGDIRHTLALSAHRPLGLFTASLVSFLGVKILNLEGLTYSILSSLLQILLSLSIVWFFYRSIEASTLFAKRFASKTESDLDDQLVPLISKALKVLILTLGVLVTIQNLGINIMSLVAGLGLGGLAFALAAKDTAANFFGSLMILVDNPFKVGDWIVTNGAEGTVEEIGFRSTRIRTFYNSVISLPNSVLVNTNIDNMGKRMYRRTNITLNLTYNTSPQKLQIFRDEIKTILEQTPTVLQGNFHVVFSQFSSSSLDILLYFFLKVENWEQELKERELIYFQILKLAEQHEVDFAFPTQSLYIENFPENTNTL